MPCRRWRKVNWMLPERTLRAHCSTPWRGESGIRIVASTAQETAEMDCVYNGLVIRSGLPGASPADITADTLKTRRFSTTLPTPSGYFF